MERPTKRIKRSKSDPDFQLSLVEGNNEKDDDDDDDVVVILDAKDASASSTSMVNLITVDQTEVDDEVAIVGEKNAMKLPHARQDCTDCKFVSNVCWGMLSFSFVNALL